MLSFLLATGYCLLFYRHSHDVGHRLSLDFSVLSDDDELAVFDRDAAHGVHEALDSHAVSGFDD